MKINLQKLIPIIIGSLLSMPVSMALLDLSLSTVALRAVILTISIYFIWEWWDSLWKKK